MSDSEQLDVLIAVYLIPDLAKQDFDAFLNHLFAGARFAARKAAEEKSGKSSRTGDRP